MPDTWGADASVFYTELFNHKFRMPWIGFDLPTDICAADDLLGDFSLLLTIFVQPQFLGLDLIGFGQFTLKPVHK